MHVPREAAVPAESWAAAVILLALNAYLLLGGADFGGGIWDLFASGRTAERQRELLEHAIGPIWEANHVWLIVAIVVLFSCFPPAFAALATALHVPLALMLVGIVLRGSAFTFRAYDMPSAPRERAWSRVFAVASVVSPLMLGVCAGAVASGAITMDPGTGRPVAGFVASWMAPFPWAVGAMTLALCAFLAATYVILETRDAELRRAFRGRALIAAVAVGVAAWLAFWLAGDGAPRIREGLAARPWSLMFHIVTASAAVGAIGTLWWERYAWARFLAGMQTTLIVWGWGLAQYPHMIGPGHTIDSAAASPRVIGLVLWTLVIGGAFLLPALAYLFRVFKAGHAR
jgi:cytochrome d ubiquinol oxidase subunit II